MRLEDIPVIYFLISLSARSPPKAGDLFPAPMEDGDDLDFLFLAHLTAESIIDVLWSLSCANTPLG